MLYLIWSLFNIALFLYFIFICFRATQYVREKLGILTSVIFVVGLLSFINSNGDRNDGSSQIKHWEFTSDKNIVNGTEKSAQITIEKTLPFNIYMEVLYGIDGSSKTNIPVNACSLVSGFQGGYEWHPSLITVDVADTPSKFQYSVSGVVVWKLLGATIYSQRKTYNGFINVK